MPGRYDTGGSYQPLSPNFANFQVLASPPANPGAGRSYFDLSLGLGVFANSIWNYASGGAGAITSVFGRIGVVVAASNDYTFAQIGSKPTTVVGYGITDALTASSTNTFTNKTFDTAGAGNSLLVGGVSITSTTGTGANVLATSPTLVTPILGTPTSGTLTSCTGLPISTGVSGLAAGVAAFLATPSSANLITAVTDETGTGALVFATSPALVTPTLGIASATTVNKITITAPATSATLTLAQGSSLVTSGANSITFTSTGATTVTLPTSGTLLAANQSITLSGDISGSGATAITTAIGANKVTLGMQATLAAGKVIGQSGVSTATPVAVNVPILIASGTASAQATLDINLSTFNGIYLKYHIELYGFQPVTTGTTLRLQVSTNGTTFDSAASNYGWNLNFTMDSNALNGPLTNAADTAIQLTGTSGVGNGASAAYNGVIQVFNPSVATLNPSIMFDSAYNNGSTNLRAAGNGTRLTAQVTEGIRLLFSSGNITTGKYRVYGYV